ncbi:monooxygenase 2-like [Salvia miltiorrhiza]|uniref:monooxygenase 2-like n=1 Tax=Salvia miltiorrhiza TaxID=226208 RepID=UPI0025AC037D|nr:monooxygenase 2-like [Salvia miltiorrhiza]
MKSQMEPTIYEQDMLIVGGGIAGLTTALGLHKLGIRSLVLEASDGLRTTGFALTMWTNAWITLDIVGIGDTMRANSLPIEGFEVGSLDSGVFPASLVVKKVWVPPPTK